MGANIRSLYSLNYYEVNMKYYYYTLLLYRYEY